MVRLAIALLVASAVCAAADQDCHLGHCALRSDDSTMLLQSALRVRSLKPAETNVSKAPVPEHAEVAPDSVSAQGKPVFPTAMFSKWYLHLAQLAIGALCAGIFFYSTAQEAPRLDKLDKFVAEKPLVIALSCADVPCPEATLLSDLIRP